MNESDTSRGKKLENKKNYEGKILKKNHNITVPIVNNQLL